MGKSDIEDIREIGRFGENVIMQYLKSIGVDGIFQADWIIEFQGEYRLIESKHQEIYSPPPFYGHGLPKWQVDARIKFFTRTRITPYLFIVEKTDYEKRGGHHLIWHQSLIQLEMGNYIDTCGSSPRRIYDIINFKKTYFPSVVSPSLPSPKKGENKA